MKHYVLAGGFLLLTACAGGPFSGQRDLDKSEAQPGITLSCSSYKTWADCFSAAARACPSGYTELSREENWVMQQRTLRIQCK